MRKALRFAVALMIVALCLFLSGELGLTSSPKKGDSGGKLRKVALFDLDTFDVNRIFNYLENDGTIVTDDNPVGVGTEWPKGSGRHINYASGFWLGGMIGQDTVTAAAEYVSEYVPGSVDFNPAAPTTPGTPRGKNDLDQQIYKINKSDLANPLGNPDYVNWPFAEGAPYNDLNGNGIYDAGETPLIMGDQTIWYACNDFDPGPHANLFGSKTIGVELQTTIWGYNRPDAFGDMMFVKFLIINKGGKTVENTYAAAWADIDLGDANDDYVGCDTTLGLGFNWNEGEDGDYGVAAPAIGYDFFQGPVVLGAPTDTAKAFGRRIPGKKNLKMTAFSKYIRGGGNDFGDPELAVEAYSYMTGLNRIGKPIIDPNTGQPTKFAHPGDPVTGTGWLDPQSHPAADRRFLMSSGPFTLAPGDSQEVVIGMLIAQGTDAKNSVALLKRYDALAQLAYDIDFSLPPSPPPPKVDVAALPGEIILTWDDAAESYVANDPVDLDTAGLATQYTFQGYNVYQVNAENLGPGVSVKRIATFDIQDGVSKIKDVVFDEQRGENVEVTVQHGEDSGLQRFLRITTDAFAANAPLSNWRKYYFAVTAYGYNPYGIPRTLETTPTPMTILPGSTALPGTRYQYKSGDPLAVSRAGGVSDGSVVAIVVDPTRTTGHNYSVAFVEGTSGLEWQVTDESLTPKKVVASGTNQAGDFDYPVFDGVFLQVLGPPSHAKDWDFTLGPGRNTRWITGVFWASHDAVLFGGIDFVGADGPSALFGRRSSLLAKDMKTIEIRFSGTTTQKAYRYLRNAQLPPADPSFAPFIVNTSGTYAYQDARDVPFTVWEVDETDGDPTPKQLTAGFLENNVAPAGGAGKVDGQWGPTEHAEGGREILWIFPEPYDPTMSQTKYQANILTNTWFDAMYVAWTLQRRPPNPVWGEGDVLTVIANHVNTVADKFTFSAKAPTKGDLTLAKSQAALVNVFPNPYFGQNLEERDPLNRYVTFTHLPATAKIRIFTLAGDVVRTIDHSNGTFERWDLRNQDGIPVASGIYIVHIDLGNIGQKILKVAVMIPEERLDVF